MKQIMTLVMGGLVLMFLVSSAIAEPVEVYSENGPQDPLYLDGWVHECGDPPTFGPGHEELVSSWTYTTETACSEWPYDDPGITNVLIEITNQTCCDSLPLWYVADPETSLSNYDGWIGNAGLADAEEAFKIDHIGVNQPLVFESMAWDNLFQPGETWRFIIQDFVNTLGGSPAPFDSIGIAGGSTGWSPSTGSIIPEPATLTLLTLGGLLLVRRRR